MFLIKKIYFVYFILIFYFLFIYLFIYIFVYLFIFFFSFQELPPRTDAETTSTISPFS